MQGKLTVITGCMFSGKTTRLITLAQKALAENKKIAIYYPEIDTRYKKNYITSHDAISLPSKSLPVDIASIDSGNTEIIFLDEIHFFKASIITAIEKLLINEVTVIVSGLDTNFRGEPFTITTELISNADHVIHLEAKCTICGSPAIWTYRVDAKKDDETIVIGGLDMYEARCTEHFNKPE